ncbi:MAG: DNA-3-methyladenine glycosylase 2 family protein [Planctomycetales bacterium]|nr:DNA-3-methyladenine glycosylase 2 family protein [Planctomycetales bacterium]
MSFTPQDVTDAVKHLRRKDRVLRDVIDRIGPCQLKPDRRRFRMLARSIIGQQISGSAARSIWRQLETLMAPAQISAAALSDMTPERLRTAGVSPQKAGYLLDLSKKVIDGDVRLPRLSRLSDDAVIAELIKVKGIGEWTAQMFLMFSLGRLDVLPHQDLGIRTAMRNLYDLADLPDKATCHTIARPWRPFATIASWYSWRSLDLKARP